MNIDRFFYYGHFLKSLLIMNKYLLRGMWKLTQLPQPAITIFGGSRLKVDSPTGRKAAELAKQLVCHGFSIITGGGPGIMEAANYGAISYLKECNLEQPTHCPIMVSAGIGLIKLNKERANPYVQNNIVMDHFFTRKWLLVRYSVGYVFFPGGFGTLDEFFEIVTLVQCEKMPRYPLILVDREYWKPIIEWIKARALRDNLIEPEHVDLVIIVDTVEEAVAILKECSKNASCEILKAGN